MTRAPLDMSPAHVTARALDVLGRIRRAVPRTNAPALLTPPSMSLPFSTTYRLTDSAATEYLR